MMIITSSASKHEENRKLFKKVSKFSSIVEIAGFEVKLAGPNPFNPSTSLNVVVPDAGHVTVKIYNIVGQHVATLADGYMDRSAAGHTLHWNASQMASGVYLVRAETASSVSTQKLMLLK